MNQKNIHMWWDKYRMLLYKCKSINSTSKVHVCAPVEYLISIIQKPPIKIAQFKLGISVFCVFLLHCMYLNPPYPPISTELDWCLSDHETPTPKTKQKNNSFFLHKISCNVQTIMTPLCKDETLTHMMVFFIWLYKPAQVS